MIKNCCSFFIKSIIVTSILSLTLYIDLFTYYIVPCPVYIIEFILCVWIVDRLLLIILSIITFSLKLYDIYFPIIPKDMEELKLMYNSQIIFSLIVFPLILSVISKQIEKIKEISIKDPLTKLYDIDHFNYLLDNEVNRCYRYKKWLTIVFLDIDGFKYVNDKLGHIQANKVLQEFATILKTSVRKIDSVARMGGDEFAIILVESSPSNASEIISRIRNKIKIKFKKLNISCSYGILSINCEKVDQIYLSQDLIDIADAEMYKIKNSSKDNISHKIIGL